MSVITTLIEPHRVTRVFFDSRAVVPNPTDLRRIEQAIELLSLLWQDRGPPSDVWIGGQRTDP